MRGARVPPLIRRAARQYLQLSDEGPTYPPQEPSPTHPWISHLWDREIAKLRELGKARMIDGKAILPCGRESPKVRGK